MTGRVALTLGLAQQCVLRQGLLQQGPCSCPGPTLCANRHQEHVLCKITFQSSHWVTASKLEPKQLQDWKLTKKGKAP